MKIFSKKPGRLVLLFFFFGKSLYLMLGIIKTARFLHLLHSVYCSTLFWLKYMHKMNVALHRYTVGKGNGILVVFSDDCGWLFDSIPKPNKWSF